MYLLQVDISARIRECFKQILRLKIEQFLENIYFEDRFYFRVIYDQKKKIVNNVIALTIVKQRER